MWSDKLIFLEQSHHLQATVSDACFTKFSQRDKSSLWPKRCSCGLFRRALAIIKHFFYIPSVRRCLVGEILPPEGGLSSSFNPLHIMSVSGMNLPSLQTFAHNFPYSPKCNMFRTYIQTRTLTEWENWPLVSNTLTPTAFKLWSLLKGKAIPLQPWTGPEGSRKLRLPDFKTIGTRRW